MLTYLVASLITAFGALLSISLIRKALKQYFPNIQENHFESAIDVVSIVIVAVGLVIGAVNYSDEVKKGNKLNAEIETLEKFSDVAKLNILGKPGIAQPPLTETTPESKLLEGALIETGNRVQIKCDSESLKKFQTVVEKFPNFPFAYYYLALCLRNSGDNKWRDYAHKAIEIFKKTTMLAEHHPSQDLALKELQDILKLDTPIPSSN